MYEIIDVHGHYLPGLDDGASNVRESIQMMKQAAGQGVRALVLTPHYRREMFEVRADLAGAYIKKFQEALYEMRLSLKLYQGQEIYYFHGVEKLIDGVTIQGMNGTRYVLVEFSISDDWHYIRDALMRLQSAGFFPVIAHIERYADLYTKLPELMLLHEQGILFQVNARSITSFGIRKGQKFIKALLKEELIDLIGSDAHGIRHRAPEFDACIRYLEKKCRSQYVKEILGENAGYYFELK